MRWRFFLVSLILACAPAAPAGAAPELAPARDLQSAGRDAARGGQVVLLVYTLDDCPYCETAMSEYLIPLAASPAYRPRVRVFEVKMDGEAPLTDFAGRRSTHRAFARAQGVQVAPTVHVFLPTGERAAEPVVGLTLIDFYGAYVDRAIDAALAKARSARR